jgi:hypothetical protein
MNKIATSTNITSPMISTKLKPNGIISEATKESADITTSTMSIDRVMILGNVNIMDFQE